MDRNKIIILLLSILVYEETDIGPVPGKNKDMTPEERERSFESMVGTLLESLC